MIKKLVLLLFLFLFIHVLVSSSQSSFFARQLIHGGMEELVPPALAQGTGKDEKEDTHTIALLKQIRETVEDWLKSLNEKIEQEDITRFKVRFYEFLRNILEWVKEKLDAKIESSEEKKPKIKEKGLLFRETRQRGLPFLELG